MSKKKIRSDFDRLECGETEKMFAGTWLMNMEFQQARGNLLCSCRMVFPGGSKLGKNETNDADTLIIHDTAFAHIFISSAFYTLGFNLSLCLSCLKHTASVCLYTIKYKVSKCSQKPARFCYRYVNSLLIQLQLVNNQHQRHQKCRVPVCRNIKLKI